MSCTCGGPSSRRSIGGKKQATSCSTLYATRTSKSWPPNLDASNTTSQKGNDKACFIGSCVSHAWQKCKHKLHGVASKNAVQSGLKVDRQARKYNAHPFLIFQAELMRIAATSRQYCWKHHLYCTHHNISKKMFVLRVNKVWLSAAPPSSPSAAIFLPLGLPRLFNFATT